MIMVCVTEKECGTPAVPWRMTYKIRYVVRQENMSLAHHTSLFEYHLLCGHSRATHCLDDDRAAVAGHIDAGLTIA